jgi:cell wall-associated NlpC family hydrolase
MIPPHPPSLWTPEVQALGLAEAQRWHGTQHRDRMAKVGVGIDCLYFVREILVAAGLLPSWRFPFYKPAWGVGRDFNVMERVFLKCCHARVLDDGEPWLDGDILVFSVGRQSNHVGMILGGQVWHSVAARGVENVDLDHSITDAMQSVLRLVEPGFISRPEELTPADFAV